MNGETPCTPMGTGRVTKTATGSGPGSGRGVGTLPSAGVGTHTDIAERVAELDGLEPLFIAYRYRELRTPLDSIISFAGGLLQGIGGELNQCHQDRLERVSPSGEHPPVPIRRHFPSGS